MKRSLIILLLLISFKPASSQITTEKPKLVVGIVVDQMRYDYLTRFWDQYSDKGFKRMVNQGYNFKNHHFNYVPTYTGPGHASVFTGTTPSNHGIIGNNWYDKFEESFVYCTGDDEVDPVGTKDRAGKMSPHRMASTTFGDENRLQTQGAGKTIGIALKDRGAILPAGHAANAAYWFHGDKEARWITSSYYMEQLPQWVQDFNDAEIAKTYLKTWTPLKDINSYLQSGIDRNNFEFGFDGKDTAEFPYDLKALARKNDHFDIIKATPFGNDLTAAFAKAAITGESLGQDEVTDVLTLSFSSTDYVGHNFGVNSKEIQDTYMRLDLNIAEILEFLDEQVGEDEYTVFLTADHGGVDVPAYLRSQKVPAGYFDELTLKEKLGDFSSRVFKNKDIISNISNGQVFLNYEKLLELNLSVEEVTSIMSHFLLKQDKISRVFTRNELQTGSFNNQVGELVQNGFHQKRSGDLVYVVDPGYIVYPEKGTTHGSGFTYDTHAPLLFYGKGIRKGETFDKTFIRDIAPTVSAMLGIAFPNASTGNPLKQVLEQ